MLVDHWTWSRLLCWKSNQDMRAGGTSRSEDLHLRILKFLSLTSHSSSWHVTLPFYYGVIAMNLLWLIDASLVVGERTSRPVVIFVSYVWKPQTRQLFCFCLVVLLLRMKHSKYWRFFAASSRCCPLGRRPKTLFLRRLHSQRISYQSLLKKFPCLGIFIEEHVLCINSLQECNNQPRFIHWIASHSSR